MNWRLTIAAFVLTGSPALAQTDISPIRAVDVPLTAWVGSRAHALPDTLASFDTDETRRKQFRELLAALADRKWPEADRIARGMKYYLVGIRDRDSLFIVASDNTSSGRDPIIVLNNDAQRDVIIEAPHVPFEIGTGEQAVVFLTRLKGRAALIAGAHRCASKTLSTCDGRTEVCTGSLEAYRDSDAGHNLNTLFHEAHLVLADRWPNSVVMSLHGMMEDNKGVKTSLIISNGAHDADSDQKSVATRFRVATGEKIGTPGTAVSCNYPADEKFEFRKLCGYTNIQGRHVNGGANTCRASVDSGTGRFVHLEQDWSILQRYAEGWSGIDADPVNKVLIDALVSTLPAVK